MKLKAAEDLKSPSPGSNVSCCSGLLHPSGWLVAAVVLAVGCSDADLAPGCGALAKGPVTAVSWWLENHEREAWESLNTDFVNCNPEASVAPVAFADKAEATRRYAAMLNEMEEEGTPAKFDVMIGNVDLMQFAGCEGRGPGQLRGLRGADRIGIGQRQFFPELLKALSCAGAPETLYAVPLSTHRLNNLFYNKERLSEVGLGAADLESWDGFERALERLKKQEEKYAEPRPILAVSREDWRASLLAFENVMVSAIGRQGYLEFWQGSAGGAGEPPLSRDAATLRRLERLKEFLTPFKPGEDQVAVSSGRAVFTVTGDWWAPSAMPTVGDGPSLDDAVAQVPFPETSGVYVYTADVLAIPLRPPHPQAALAYLRSATSDHVISKFSELKNAQPAREDLSDLVLVRVPSLPFLVPHLAFDYLGKKLGDWLFDDPESKTVPDDLLDYINTEYCRLRQAQECLPLSPSSLKPYRVPR